MFHFIKNHGQFLYSARTIDKFISNERWLMTEIYVFKNIVVFYIYTQLEK